MTQSQITAATVVVAAKDQISADLADEAAILNLKTGVYFGLDDVAASVWHLIQKPVTVAAICDALVESYDVERGQVEADVIELLTDMIQEGLVERLPGEASVS